MRTGLVTSFHADAPFEPIARPEVHFPAELLYDVETEELVLAKMMMQAATNSPVSLYDLSDKDFARQGNRLVFRAIKWLVEGNIALLVGDICVVGHHLSGKSVVGDVQRILGSNQEAQWDYVVMDPWEAVVYDWGKHNADKLKKRTLDREKLLLCEDIINAIAEGDDPSQLIDALGVGSKGWKARKRWK